ncbi:MAG: ADP-ribosylation factor-like protein [Promethearchaeota archaeon]
MLYQKIFLFGIDKSGKTSLSQAMRTGKYEGDVFPTIDFDIRALFLQYFKDSIEFKVWDAPGQVKYRNAWDEGYKDANLMIFVLDTAEDSRFEEAKETLMAVLEKEETKKIPLIILLHKIDLDKAKENYYKAMNTFKPTLIPKRDIYILHSSVNEPRTLDDIKEVIAIIVEKGRSKPI